MLLRDHGGGGGGGGCKGELGGGLQRASFDITVELQADWKREVKISLAHASLIIDLPGCDPGA